MPLDVLQWSQPVPCCVTLSMNGVDQQPILHCTFYSIHVLPDLCSMNPPIWVNGSRWSSDCWSTCVIHVHVECLPGTQNITGSNPA